MVDFEKLIALYDLKRGTVWPTEQPSEESLAAINAHFGVSLPPLLIELARRSERFGAYFAGLGNDFDSDDHIIRVNRRFAKMRRRTRHGWRRAKPEYLLIFNQGFDDDCDCFDLRSWNAASGDYKIQYWTPSDRGREPEPQLTWPTFHAYFEHLALRDLERLRGEQRDEVLRILGREWRGKTT